MKEFSPELITAIGMTKDEFAMIEVMCSYFRDQVQDEEFESFNSLENFFSHENYCKFEDT
jgi:hypothetical protein